jgi:hypothetical protein
MDWDGFYWQSPKLAPEAPGIYPVLVTVCDYLTGEPRESCERFARWNGSRWCCWGMTPERAALAYFPGPAAGYPWRQPDGADTIAA